MNRNIIAIGVAVVLSVTTIGFARMPRSLPVPLEIIVLAEPDWLIVSSYRPDQASLARTLLRHPSLKSRLAARSVVLPTKLWVCGNPIVVEAVERLASSRGS